MDTSFLDISCSLVKSDFDTQILQLFKIENLDNIADHAAAFIGCDPFRAELSKIQEDLEKYKALQMRSDELIQDSLQNDAENHSASLEFISKMQAKWNES